MASSVEKSAWKKHSCCDPEGVQLFPYMAKLSHGLDNVSKGGMTDFIAQNLDSIGFSTVAENLCKREGVCSAQHRWKQLFHRPWGRNDSSISAWWLGPGEGSEAAALVFPALERSIPGSAHYTNSGKSEGEQLGSTHLTVRRHQYRKKEMAKLDLAVLAVLVCSLVLVGGLLTSNVTLEGRQAPH